MKSYSFLHKLLIKVVGFHNVRSIDGPNEFQLYSLTKMKIANISM